MKYSWYFSVYGTGLGHISRSLWLASKLEGHKYFSTWGEALKLASSYPSFRATPLDVVWTEEGRMSLKKTFRRFYMAFSSLALQIREELNNINSVNPSAVISDSRISPLIASMMAGRRSVLIINQPRVLLPLRKGIYIALERAFGELLGLIWDLAEVIIVPDLPPPYTISAYSLNLKTIEKKIVHAGFFSDPPKEEARCREAGDKTVFVPISGPPPTKDIVLKLIRKASEILPDGYRVLVSLGDYDKRGYRYDNGRLSVVGWDENRQNNMLCSDVLVLRGGLTTIGEGILYGKPMIVMPISLHGEQEQNARRVAELGLGLYADQYRTKPGDLAWMIQEVLGNDRYMSNARRLMRIARLQNTAERVKSMLENIAYGSSS
ncbi:MAG: glycosyltransferase [Nitrososphaeria archaeon]